MTAQNMIVPVELTDAELDAVAGGLIVLNVSNVANSNEVDVRVPITVRDVNVGVAAAVAVLGGAVAFVDQV